MSALGEDGTGTQATKIDPDQPAWIYVNDFRPIIADGGIRRGELMLVGVHHGSGHDLRMARSLEDMMHVRAGDALLALSKHYVVIDSERSIIDDALMMRTLGIEVKRKEKKDRSKRKKADWKQKQHERLGKNEVKPSPFLKKLVQRTDKD